MTENSNDISCRTYWIVSVSIVAAYLALWLANFRHVYGWVMDDRLVYEKACKTVADLLAPFTADDRNALHFYFYLISLLPAALPLKLRSFVLPVFGDQTGHFRFLLLYSVFLHGLLLLIWGAFAAQFCRSRLTALGSLVVFAASPSLFLWSPQPDSRYFGLLAGLPGAWLMMTNEAGGRDRKRKFLAGLLCSVALSIHYTSAYLLGPLAICHWLGAMIDKGRRRAEIGNLLTFGVAFVIPIVSVELISRFVAGLPWEKGPAMFAVHSGAQHTSKFTLSQNLETWLRSAMSQFGPLLPALILAGWVVQVFRALRRTATPGERTIALAIPLATAMLLFSGKMPFFRMTTVLQPFYFLSASIVVMAIVQKAAKEKTLQLILAVIRFERRSAFIKGIWVSGGRSRSRMRAGTATGLSGFPSRGTGEITGSSIRRIFATPQPTRCSCRIFPRASLGGDQLSLPDFGMFGLLHRSIRCGAPTRCRPRSLPIGRTMTGEQIRSWAVHASFGFPMWLQPWEAPPWKYPRP